MRSFVYRPEEGEVHVDLVAEDGTTVLTTANFPTEDSTTEFFEQTWNYHCEEDGVDPLTEEELAAYSTWIRTQIS